MKLYHSIGKWFSKGLHVMIQGKTGAQGQAYIQKFDINNRNFVDHEALANAQLMAASPVLLIATINAKERLNQLMANPKWRIAGFGSVYKEFEELQSAITEAVYIPKEETADGLTIQERKEKEEAEFIIWAVKHKDEILKKVIV